MKSIFSQIKRFENQEFTEGQSFTIVIPVKVSTTGQKDINDKKPEIPSQMKVGNNYKVTVKKYMTEEGTPSFDFMIKWNNNIPMPLRIMVGKVIKETRGMVYMELQGKCEPAICCMKCGRHLTNKVSQLYGIGPECGQHFSINPFDTEEELNEHLQELKSQISNIKWTGWVIKSAITEYEEVI